MCLAGFELVTCKSAGQHLVTSLSVIVKEIISICKYVIARVVLISEVVDLMFRRRQFMTSSDVTGHVMF